MNIRKWTCFFLSASIMLFVTINAYCSASPCNLNKSTRLLIGKTPITSELRNSAVKAGVVFFKDGEFYEETFLYIGEVVQDHSKKWHVAQLKTIWGNSCRGTSRLLIFSEDKKYIGEYSHYDAIPIRIENNQIIFDATPESGNSIIFDEEGPPKKVRINGDFLEFY